MFRIPTQPLPRNVDRFDHAKARGLTPTVPPVPPQLSLPTAQSLLRRLGFTIGLAVTTTLVAVNFISTPIGWIPVLGASIYLSYQALKAFRSRLIEEMQAGYVTTTFYQGSFWFRQRSRHRLDTIGWDWKGLWVLDASGEVVSAPDPSADPPGLYPSPHSPGERELWTGNQWTYQYPDRDGKAA